MIIEISGGHDKVAEYLINGLKSGRSFNRDADKRVTLLGNLDTTKQIYQSIDSDGERYHHITLSFKEDDISIEDMQKVIDEFNNFIKEAWGDSINIYAEAHMPRLKSYYTKKGRLMIRKPHIHIVVPNIDLKTGKYITPLGYVDNNLHYINAFQEFINEKYNFASPKSNRQNSFQNEADILMEHRGDLFYQSVEEKTQILDLVLNKDIKSWNDLQQILQSLNIISKIANKKKAENEQYLSVKFEHRKKDVRLKDYVFSKEFISKSKEEKLHFLHKEINAKYENKKVISDQKIQQKNIDLLQYWKDIRSLEIKHINTGSKYYKEAYKKLSKEEKIKVLNSKEIEYQKKYNILQEVENEIRDVRIDISLLEDNEVNFNEEIKNIKIDSVVSSKLDEAINQQEIKRIKEIQMSLIVNQEEIKKIFKVAQTENRKSKSKTNIDFLNASYLQFDGLYLDDLEKWRANAIENGTSLKIADGYVNATVEQATKLQLNGLLKKVGNSYQFTSSHAKRALFNKYNGSMQNIINEYNLLRELKAEAIYNHTKETYGVDNRYKLQADSNIILAGSKEYTGESFLREELHLNENEISSIKNTLMKRSNNIVELLEKYDDTPKIQVNIMSNNAKTHADYMQMCQVDKYGKQTGIIIDHVDKKGNTGLVYVINNRIVDEQEFKELDNYKSFENKYNSLFENQNEMRYSKTLKTNYINTNIKLKAETLNYINSKDNFDTLRPIEIGINKFKNSKSLSKNLFTIARDWYLEKYVDFKDKLQDVFASKRDLIAANVELLKELQMINKDLLEIQSKEEAEHIRKENEQAIEDKKLEEIKKSTKDDITLKDIINKSIDLKEKFDKFNDTKDNIEALQDHANALLNNKDKIKISAEQLQNLNFNQIVAASAMVGNGLIVSSLQDIQTAVKSIKYVYDTIENNNLQLTSEQLEKSIKNKIQQDLSPKDSSIKEEPKEEISLG